MFLSDELIFLTPENSLPGEAKGNFNKQIMVISLRQPEFTEGGNFLSKVFAAAQVDFAKDTLWIELGANQPLAISAVLQQKPATKVLVFGIAPQQIGLNIDARLYQITGFKNTQFLFGDSLQQMEPDKDKKAKLWTALKQMFL